MGYSFKWILEHLSQSFAIGTASYAENAGTASFVTASNVWDPLGPSSVESSSYALTASYALNASGAPQGPQNSIQFNSGSVLGGSANFLFVTESNLLQLTGSMDISGALSASFGPNTVGFFGTSSWSVSSSQAVTASYVRLLQGPNIVINYQTDGTTWSAWSSSANAIGNYIRYTADDGIIGNLITVRALLTQA